MDRYKILATFITGFFIGFVAGALAVVGFATFVSHVGYLPSGSHARPRIFCTGETGCAGACSGSGALPVLGGKGR